MYYNNRQNQNVNQMYYPVEYMSPSQRLQYYEQQGYSNNRNNQQSIDNSYIYQANNQNNMSPNIQAYNNGMNTNNANTQSIIWVQGLEGAKSYFLPPNTSPLILMDSESQRFYMKSTDYNGMPNLRVFDFNEVTDTLLNNNKVQNQNTVDFASKEELNQLRNELNDLMSMLTTPTTKEIGGNKNE